MKELLRTNNAIEMSWTKAILSEVGIECVLMDQHASIMEGSICAIQQRLMVLEDDFDRAKRVIEAAQKDLEA